MRSMCSLSVLKAVVSKVSRYWQWVSVDVEGNSKVDLVSPARAFVQSQFAPLIDEYDQVEDSRLQDQLYQQMQSTVAGNGSVDTSALAKLCLQCFVSQRP